MSRLIAPLFLLAAALLPAADWKSIHPGPNLEGWEIKGPCEWKVLKDGTLVGQRRATIGARELQFPISKEDFWRWVNQQAWVYSIAEFGEFDLRFDYWLTAGGNSGVSIGDRNRAKYAAQVPSDFTRTPARTAYEIQLNNRYPDPVTSGSVYRFQTAKTGVQIDDEWNKLEIEVRANRIRTKINGQVVAEHPGDPARPKNGPIGIQIHDQFTVVMVRDIQVREVSPR